MRFLTLKKLATAPIPDPQAAEVRVYADNTGDLRKIDHEGNDEAVGAGGSLPAGGTTGQVLTKASNADGDADWEASGGSVPSNVRRLDLGVLAVTDVLTDALLLYTPEAGELAGPVWMTDVVYTDALSLSIGTLNTDPHAVIARVGIDNVNVFDSVGLLVANDGLSPAPGDTVAATQLVTEPIYAGIGDGNLDSLALAWQANHLFTGVTHVIGDGHLWIKAATGTTGGVEPDWSSGFGGSVMDNGIEWFDVGALPTVGEAHFYLDVCAPEAP